MVLARCQLSGGIAAIGITAWGLLGSTMDVKSQFEEMCAQVRSCSRQQCGLCACSDANCRASSTLALGRMCKSTYEQVESEYDAVRGAYRMIIQEEDSPSFDEFLALILNCKDLFQCSSACECSCHFGQIENWRDVSPQFRKPSLFNLLASTQKGVPIGNKIDISKFTNDEKKLLTFGGQAVVVGDRKMLLHDVVNAFREQSQWTCTHETSLDQIKKVPGTVSDYTFNNYKEMDDEQQTGPPSIPRVFWDQRLGKYTPACTCHYNIESYHAAPNEILDLHGIPRSINKKGYIWNNNACYFICLTCTKPFHKACYEDYGGDFEDPGYVPHFCKECRHTGVLTEGIMKDLTGMGSDTARKELDWENWKYYCTNLQIVAFPSLTVKLLIASYAPATVFLSSLIIDDGDSKKLFPTPMAYAPLITSPKDLSLNDAITSLFLSVCIQYRDDVHDSKVLAESHGQQQETTSIQTVQDWISAFGNNPAADETFFKENNKRVLEKIKQLRSRRHGA